MCKETIEKAVHTVPSADGDWNIQSKVLLFSYDPTQTSSDKILKRIAEAGYDNECYLADDEAYNSLHACCFYDRDIDWDELKNKAENGVITHSISHEDNHDANHQEGSHHDIKPDEHSQATSETDEWLTTDEAIALSTVQLKGNKAQTALDAKSAGLTFKIDKTELLKAACCNLSESFETNATVDVNYANAVTGTKQIKMLGVDQKYTLISKELLPDIRGLASPYGMNFIPGRWISGIQLTKGGSTVTNGHESISGHINTEFVKFHTEPTASINLFADIQTRVEGNVVWADALNEKWNNSVLLHANSTIDRLDENNDGFIDQPVGNQLNATYLLNYNDLDNSGIGTHFGVNILSDNRIAGSMDFDENLDRLGTTNYGVGIDINRFQIWNKTGYIFKDKPYQSIGWMNQYTHHEQDSYFGTTPYIGTEHTFYSNLVFESILGSTLHKYKAGLSFLYDQFDETYRAENYDREETAPGAFAEYTYTRNKLTAVLGARVDFHNLAGTQFTPRVNLKYDIVEKTTLRASAGRGFRTANTFAESQAYLASNRTVEIISSNDDVYGLDPEIAWNYGVSLNQEFKFLRHKSNITIDYFRTEFENQILPDLDASPHKILFYNMEGDSYANAFQIQWDLEPIKRLKLRLAYKNYQTQVSYLSGENEIPFTAEHRGFANLAYSTFTNGQGQNWTFDTTLQWIGEQRIPDTSSSPITYQLPDYADAYFVLNAQMARQFNKTLRMYLGAENLLSYEQENPILQVDNPFGENFDGGMVWAPIMPANFYIGLDINF
ncbi:TonB-dependent receptor [Flavobacteriaceae bacterium Ap0902]|nr:TonB-dependent receptor [Flavobacteriaceae bacterium Ap0902]